MRATLLHDFDPNFRCSACNMVLGNKANYRLYLKIIHKMKMTPLKPKPNWNITPDPNNSNNHCDSCSRTYTSKGNYRQHLIRMHKLIIPPKFQRTTANPNVLPDIDDPNYSCKSCQITCNDRRHYRIHFWIKHQMEMKLLRKQAKFDPAITVHDTKSPNNQSCAICKLIYSSQKTYRKHMKKYHEDGEHTPTIRNKVTPNPTSSLILKTQHSIVARAKKYYSKS